jgi:uncharacterized protein (TIGR01319 family)
MRAVALADFGSTFTKVTLVEDGSGRLLARCLHPTTIGSDVLDGYHAALDEALRQVAREVDVVAELAASSAGGGLRMAAIGLVAELTAAAGRHAALNAGARVELVAAGDLDRSDRDRLAQQRPEVLLFCGGTDGGQRRKVLDNATAVADVDGLQLVVVACNAYIADAVAARFRRPGRTVHVVDNVLPAIDRLNIEPARRAIHDLFIRHVIGGKRLSSGDAFATMVRTPTPEAVLDAVRLLAEDDQSAGARGIVVVDVGGATTDVHSAVTTIERPAHVTATGLPVLPVMRTVQGDLGMRSNADTVVASDGAWLRSELGLRQQALDDAAHRRRCQPNWLADSPAEQQIDDAFAVSCVHLAIGRHCGTLTTTYVPGQGAQFVQRGIDLREAALVIGTGGALVHRAGSEALVGAAIGRRSAGSLAPVAPRIAIDRSYVLAAAGLLSAVDRDAARCLLEPLWLEPLWPEPVRPQPVWPEPVWKERDVR